MKIASIIGTRPQFIKAAALSPKLRQYHDETIIHTGQHYDYLMSKVFFDELQIPEPAYNLNVNSGAYSSKMADMIKKIEVILRKLSPSFVLVYGDSDSTLAGALAASNLRIPVGHIEAGLRSFERTMPEEVNRALTDNVSSVLFCPTRNSVENLAKEGFKRVINGGKLARAKDIKRLNNIGPSSPLIVNTGDVMFDIFLKYADNINKNFNVLDKLNLRPGSYYLATIHRQENTDVCQNLKNIAKILGGLDKKVIFPAHPRTKKSLKKMNIYLGPRIKLIEPKTYLEMLVLEKNAHKILTDSGGVQREAYFLKKPCIILRKTTEWVELLQGNETNSQFYGDGEASEKIIAILNRLRL